MALTQTRPYELDLFIDNVSDPDYVPVAERLVMIDNAAWDEPKYVPADTVGGSGTGLTIAKDTLTGLLSSTVTESFGLTFSSTPIAVAFKVYRYYEVESGSGEYVRKDVTYSVSGSGWYTTTGFTIEIDSDESLTGVYIDYLFM